MDRLDEAQSKETQNTVLENEDFRLVEVEDPNSVDIEESESELAQLKQKEQELEVEIKRLLEELENLDKHSTGLTMDDLVLIEEDLTEAERLDEKCSEILQRRAEILKLGLFSGKGQKIKANSEELKNTRLSRDRHLEQAILKLKSAGLEITEGKRLEDFLKQKKEVENISTTRENKELELKTKQLELKEIKKRINFTQQIVNQHSIEQPEDLSLDEESEDKTPGPEDIAVKKDLIEKALSDIVKVVSKRELEILRMLFIDNLTLTEIGDQQKVTPNRIGQIRDRAIEKIRRKLGSKYENIFDIFN